MASTPSALADRLISKSSAPMINITRDAGLIFAGSLFVALLAQAQIPLQPVPVTLQTFGVLLIGAVLGSRRGALAMLAYAIEGAAGLPVFAGGTFGVARIIGPTGGYIIGFIFAGMLVGWLAERGWDRTPWMMTLAMIAGNIVIYSFGAPWLAYWLHSFSLALQYGVYPFLIGDMLKIVAAAIALPLAHWVVNAVQLHKGK